MTDINITFTNGRTISVYGDLTILKNGDYTIRIEGGMILDIKKEDIRELSCETDIMY